jgi:hypothetical protein
MNQPSNFDFEVLERRTLLSVSIGSVASPAGARDHAFAAVTATPTNTGILGTLTGSYTERLPQPGDGALYRLVGSGRAGALGKVTASGAVRTHHLLVTSQDGGSIVLRNARGSVTVKLIGLVTGPIVAGASAGSVVPVPIGWRGYTYTVVSGTGAYTNFHAAGMASFTFTPVSLAAGDAIERGRFTLTFDPFEPVPLTPAG